MSVSNYLEDLMLDMVLGDGHTVGMPDEVYLALYLDAPGDDGIATEPSTGDYARALVTNNSANWPDAALGVKSNGAQITFAEATGTWGEITHWALYDDVSGGNVLFYGTVVTPETVVSGDIPFVGVGEVIISLD